MDLIVSDPMRFLLIVALTVFAGVVLFTLYTYSRWIRAEERRQVTMHVLELAVWSLCATYFMVDTVIENYADGFTERVLIALVGAVIGTSGLLRMLVKLGERERRG
jgi:hypothetical protein